MSTDRRILNPEHIGIISIVTNVLLILLFIFLLFKFWDIQIIKHHQFKAMSQKNIYREIEVKSPRGMIVDRNQIIMAENKLNFSLFILKENISNLRQTIEKAVHVTGLEPQLVKKRVGKFKN